MAPHLGTTARRIGAGLAPVTVASQAGDQKACHPGSHHVIIPGWPVRPGSETFSGINRPRTRA